MRHLRTITPAWTVAALALMGWVAAPLAQKVTPADAAAKLSGTWKINMDKSDVRAAQPAGGGGGGRGGGGRFEMSAVQRGGGGGGGGRGGGGGGLSDADRAAAAAMRTLTQIQSTLTITATADSVSFAGDDHKYAVTGKSDKVDFGGASINTKSSWDKLTLKQEFQSGETRIQRSWEVSPDGATLTLKMAVVDFSKGDSASSADRKAVYDKQN